MLYRVERVVADVHVRHVAVIDPDMRLTNGVACMF